MVSLEAEVDDVLERLLRGGLIAVPSAPMREKEKKAHGDWGGRLKEGAHLSIPILK
jgi:hypothetical protein